MPLCSLSSWKHHCRSIIKRIRIYLHVVEALEGYALQDSGIYTVYKELLDCNTMPCIMSDDANKYAILIVLTFRKRSLSSEKDMPAARFHDIDIERQWKKCGIWLKDLCFSLIQISVLKLFRLKSNSVIEALNLLTTEDIFALAWENALFPDLLPPNWAKYWR